MGIHWRQAFSAGRKIHWMGLSLLAFLLFGLVQGCGRAPTRESTARRVEPLVRNQLSTSVTLDPGAPTAVAASVSASVVCADAECAVFYLSGVGEGCRAGGVKLSPTGKLIESSRVDFGRAGAMCTMEALLAAGRFVLGFGSPRQLLLLDPGDLHVERDFSESPFAARVDHLYASGNVLIVANVHGRPESQVQGLDVTTGRATDPAPLDPFWVPIVVPGDDQFLFFYPHSGAFARLSASTGQWLGDFQALTRDVSQLFSFNATGFYRDGVYHVAYSLQQPLPPATRGKIFGVRVDAASGQLLDAAAGQPAPQVLCDACLNGFGGAYQTQDAAFLWLQANDNDYSLVQLDLESGGRFDPSLSGPDLHFTAEGQLSSLAPSNAPRFAVVAGAIYTADSSDPARLVKGSAVLPSKSSGLAPGQLSAASNGENFVVAWNRSPHARATIMEVARGVDIGVREVVTRDVQLAAVRSAASSGRDYLLVDLQPGLDQSLAITRQLLSGDGQLGPVVSEATGLTQGNNDDAILQVASDGQRYLLVLFIGSEERNDGRLYVQRLDTAARAEEPLWLARSDVFFFDRVDANFADPANERQFAITYHALQGDSTVKVMRVPSNAGPSSEPSEFGHNGLVVANDGRELLFGAGPTQFRVRDGRFTTLTVPGFDASLVSQWDGAAYLSVTNLVGRLRVDRLDERFRSPAPVTISNESVGKIAVTNDRRGQSLIAYYSAEGPQHLLELHAALYRSDDEATAAAGEGGAGGAGDGAQGPLGEAAGTAGAFELGGEAGERSIAGVGGDGTIPDEPTAPVPERNLPTDPRSKACGCGVPARADGAAALPLVFVLSLLVRRQRRSFGRKFRQIRASALRTP